MSNKNPEASAAPAQVRPGESSAPVRPGAASDAPRPASLDTVRPVGPSAPSGDTRPNPPVAAAADAPAAHRAEEPSRPLAATVAGPVARAAGAPEPAAPASEDAMPLFSGRLAGTPPPDNYLNTVVADRYRVLRKLGEGGMGVVYLAEHVIIEKRVALKVLSEDFARKADLVQRFMQEAKAASKIGHENIVDIHDFGETPSGSVFIAMEYLDGRDLASVIRAEGALPFERCRHIVTQICRALGAAHSKGIIHRDMKPENVYLVEREGRADFAKILDFGIAKISSLDNEGGARLTRTGMIFGTPEYMSPEQARGDRADYRVDIYAVGCILYEMLTGDVPFHADTFMGVLTKHMFEQPEPPSVRAPDNQVPADVEAVVMKALAKDRDQRFQTMKEFSVALAACGGLDASEGWGSEPSGVFEAARAPKKAETARGAAAQKTAPVRGAAPPAPSVAAAEPPPPRSNALLIGGLAAALLAGGGAAAVALYRREPPPPPAIAAPVAPTPAAAAVPPATTPPPPAVAAPAIQPPPSAVPGATVPSAAASAAAPVAPAAAPSATSPPSAAAPAAAAAAPANVALTINSTPAGADIYRGKDLLGTTPARITLPSDKKPIQLLIKKHDYKDRDLEVMPDRDQTYDVDLAPFVKRSSPPRPPAPHFEPIARPLQKPPPASDPPAAKPAAGKLRDLKDPFAR